MNGKLKIIVVVPAYNEGANIGSAVKKLIAAGYDTVVVDDGSRDSTNDLAKKAGARVLRHAINRGQGAALQTGTEFAVKNGADIVVHFDGDDQFLVEEIHNLVAPLKSGEADIVFGSRLKKDNQMPWLKKKIILPIATVVNWLITGHKLSDAHCGFRALSRRAAALIAIRQDGMAHATEYLQETNRHNLNWREVPITVVYHRFGQGLTTGLKVLRDIILGRLVH